MAVVPLLLLFAAFLACAFAALGARVPFIDDLLALGVACFLAERIWQVVN